jgi:copper chaperone
MIKKMNMQTYQFKTNINCIGCVSQIEPVMQSQPAIEQWKIDLNHPLYLLTVETNKMSKEEVQGLIAKAGFEATVV